VMRVLAVRMWTGRVVETLETFKEDPARPETLGAAHRWVAVEIEAGRLSPESRSSPNVEAGGPKGDGWEIATISGGINWLALPEAARVAGKNAYAAAAHKMHACKEAVRAAAWADKADTERDLNLEATYRQRSGERLLSALEHEAQASRLGRK